MQELQTQDQAVLEQKRTAWGQMGVAVHQTEMQLQVEAQSYLIPLEVLPTAIAEIQSAEEKLVAAKKGLTAITNRRKEVTTQFDAVTARLMAPEKSFAEPIKIYTDAIIKLKKEDEANKAKLRNIEDEKNRCRTFFQDNKIAIELQLENKLTELVAKCYSHALETNVSVENIKVYLDEVTKKLTVNSFAFKDVLFANNYISVDDVAQIKKEVFIINQESYVARFADLIDAKFSDYEIAFNNKAEALAQAQKADEAAKAQAATAAQHQTMANKIESASFVPNVAPSDTKALKHGYIVDMDETVESVLIIMAAFSANINLCLPFLKVNKWFSFTAQQAATALGKVKCADNSFQPAGINFKQIEKL